MAARLFVWMVAAVLVAGCGSDSSLGVVEAVDAPDVPEALRFRGPTVSDGDLDLTTLAGRPVAFWFWGPSCSDCTASALTVETAHKVVDDVEVVGVSCGGTASLEEFEDRHGLSFPTIVDNNGLLSTEFGIACATAWVFVDPAGKVSRELRTLDFDELTDRMWSMTQG